MRRNKSRALKVFNEWRYRLNQQHCYIIVIFEVLTSSYQELGFTLSCFVIEARREDGKQKIKLHYFVNWKKEP